MRKPPEPTGTTRDERLAAALRANLARRKAWQHARTTDDDADKNDGQNDKNKE